MSHGAAISWIGNEQGSVLMEPATDVDGRGYSVAHKCLCLSGMITIMGRHDVFACMYGQLTASTQLKGKVHRAQRYRAVHSDSCTAVPFLSGTHSGTMVLYFGLPANPCLRRQTPSHPKLPPNF